MASELTVLDAIALVLTLIHFAIPSTYYYYMRRKFLSKPWRLSINSGLQPRETIIVPTFNEAGLIEGKLKVRHLSKGLLYGLVALLIFVLAFGGLSLF